MLSVYYSTVYYKLCLCSALTLCIQLHVPCNRLDTHGGVGSYLADVLKHFKVVHHEDNPR